jgi:hypothetical protein
MKTFLKVALGIALGFTLLFVGCGALMGAGFNAVVEELDNHAITQAQFDSVKTGARGNSRKRILARFGEPQPVEMVEDDLPKHQTDCLYYNRKGQVLLTYEFCFDANDRVKSKASS